MNVETQSIGSSLVPNTTQYLTLSLWLFPALELLVLQFVWIVQYSCCLKKLEWHRGIRKFWGVESSWSCWEGTTFRLHFLIIRMWGHPQNCCRDTRGRSWVCVTVWCNCGQLLHHQLPPHWFHSFGTKYSELTLDTRGITLSMRTHLFLFMFHYVGGWL